MHRSVGRMLEKNLLVGWLVGWLVGRALGHSFVLAVPIPCAHLTPGHSCVRSARVLNPFLTAVSTHMGFLATVSSWTFFLHAWPTLNAAKCLWKSSIRSDMLFRG